MKFMIAFEQVLLNIAENYRNMLRGLLVVSLNLSIFGCFVLLYSNLVKITEGLAATNQYSLLIFSEISESEYSKITKKIQNSQGVYQLKTYTAEQARVKFIETLGGLEQAVNQFDVRDFPQLIEFQLSSKSVADRILLQDLQQNPFILEVLGGEQTLAQVNVFFQLVKIMGVIFFCFLSLVLFWVVSNSMQISMLSRIEEINILNILGARPSFIRLPCLMEGVALCLLSTLIAGMVVYVLYLLAIAALTFNEATAIIRRESRFFSAMEVLLAISGMVFIGMLSSLSATNRVFELLNSTKR